MVFPRNEGGGGLIEILYLHNTQVPNLHNYFYITSETSTLHKVIIKSDKKYSQLNLVNSSFVIIDNDTKLHLWRQNPYMGDYELK